MAPRSKKPKSTKPRQRKAKAAKTSAAAAKEATTQPVNSQPALAATSAEVLQAMLDRPYPGDSEGRTYGQVILNQFVNSAARGNIIVAEKLLNRVETSAKQAGSRRRSDQQGPDGRFLPGNSLGPRWKPGESGNPNGRAGSIVDALRQSLPVVRYEEDGRTNGQLIRDMLLEQAIECGNIQAAREILDRLEGKPRQAIDVTTVEPADARIREVEVIVDSLERAAVARGEKVTPEQLATQLLAQVEGREGAGIRSRLSRGDILAYCQLKGYAL